MLVSALLKWNIIQKIQKHCLSLYFIYMSRRIGTQKKFTVLIRKLTLQHEMTFASISQNAGETKTLKATSQCVLNEQIPVIVYEDGSKNTTIQLHIIHNIHGETVQMGTITFDYKNEKILKPLSKQFFSKQLNNKNGYIQYKFIGLETKNVSQQDIATNKKIKNQLLIQLDQNKINKQEITDLMSLINDKDQIISKMNQEISRLMAETKKLNKSLSKQKAFSAQQFQKNFKINLQIPTPSVSSRSVANLKNNPDWQKQRNQYEFEREKLQRKITDFEKRQKHYKQQIENLRKATTVKQKEPRLSDLRKQIEQRYTNKDENFLIKRLNSENRIDKQDDEGDDGQKKNSYIQEQLAQQIKNIEAQKPKYFKKDIEVQLRMERQKQYLKEKEREKSRQNFQKRPRERSKSKSSFLGDSVVQHREFQKEINELEDEILALQQKLQIKDQQLDGIVMKLERAQKEIEKLEDQNIELRRTKSSLLKQVEGMTFKDGQNRQLFSGRPIQEYEKMIIKERKQIIDEKIKAEMQQIKAKNKRDEKEFNQKLQQKEMQIMRLKLSEQHANKQKQIYSNRIKQIMANTEGERKNYLYALEGAHKFETQQTRTKQLEMANNQLETTNNRLMKQKTDFQNSIKKMKTKLDERQGQWVRLKSVEAQHDYYKTQCEKFEKAHKKFQKQYESIKQYCQNLEHVVGKKPRKTFDQQINQQREERHKNQIRNRLQALIQEVKQMENKFYMEQIQIWLTQRTNVVQYYAKKLEEQKARLLELDNINEQAKLNLIQQKQKQLSQLKDQQLNDIDRKVAKLKIMIKSEQQKLVTNMIDKASVEQLASQLTEKLQKLQKQEEERKKQLAVLKQKNTKLQADLKQKNVKINLFDNEHAQKRSLALYPDDRDKDSIQDSKKSYIQQFKKSRELYMNKPFEELKKINNDLQTEKRRLENQITNIKFGFEKQRFQFNEKIRNKQREIKKIQNQTASNQKSVAKMTTDIENLKKKNDQLESCLRKTVDQLKQVSRNLELKQIQCGEALGEIKRMQKNLIAYEDAEKRMFDDVKKLKQKMLVKQNEMQQVLQQRDRKSKQIDAQRVVQIQKLVQKNKELEFKLQKQITQNISIKNENERLSQNITQYQIKLNSKEQEYEVLNEAFNIYKVESMEKQEEYEQQNNTLQNNILEIAEEIGKKQKQCTQLQIKIQYSEKRQKILSNIKLELQEQIKSIKNINGNLQAEKDQLMQKFNQQVKAYDIILHKIDDYVHQNAQLQLQIQSMDSELKNNQSFNHQIQKQVIRKQGEINNLQTKVEFLNEKINEQNKRLMELEQKEKQLENLRSQRDRQGKTEEKSRKSSEGIDLSPSSPMVQRKLLATTTNIHKSTSLINPPRSNKNLNVSLTRKNSSKQRQIQQNQQMRYSKQGMQLKVLRPVTETAQDLKVTMNMIQNKEENQRSKLNIDVQSQEQNQENLMQINQNNSNIDIKTTFNSGKAEINKRNQMVSGKRPAQLSRQLISEDEGDEENEYQFGDQKAELKERIAELQNVIEAIQQQRNGFYEQLQSWKNTYERQSNPNILMEGEKSKFEKSVNISKYNQPEPSKRLQAKKSLSNRFGFDSSNQDGDKSSVKKLDQYEKQIEELKNKSLENQLTITQQQNQIKNLESAIKQGQAEREALMLQLQELIQRLESQVSNGKKLSNQMEELERMFQNKISEYNKQIQNMVIEEMKKDETIKQTLNLIDKLNIQVKQKDSMISSVQAQLQEQKDIMERNTKKMSMNKNEYRKYQQQAQLQILRLKEKTDLLQSQKNLKSEDLTELGERYVELMSKMEQQEEKYKKIEYQMLVERSKAKQAQDKKEQALEEMKKYESSKKNLLDRLGDLQIKIGEKNQQIKEMTKETSIRFKKYEIEIESLKQQTSRVKKAIKQRQEHITNLKMQIANYNDLCEKLEKQKNILNNEITKMQKQIRQIMISYQKELNELSKDKQFINKQLENTKAALKQNAVKIEALNKQISRKSRENKEFVYKIDTLENTMEKLKQKNSREVAQLLANFQIKNDECHKIKIQLQRQTEHYFSKQCEFIADKQKKEKLEKEYNKKLQIYEKSLKQLQEEFKQLQNRPSVENWEEVCFENELYKNRIEELEDQLKNSGKEQEEKIISQFKRYKIGKQKQIQDLQSQMQKYGFKFHNMEQNNYVLKKDNQSMKVQLRTIMQEKMRMQKSMKQYEEDIQELKQQLNFYKAKRVDDLNKLLNQTYD